MDSALGESTKAKDRWTKKTPWRFGGSLLRRTLSRELERYARSTHEKIEALLQKQVIGPPAGKRNEVLHWLYPGDFNAKHFDISQKRQKNTGKWLLRAPEFVEWIKGKNRSRLLWGHGIPGAGKTFLSSAVIDHCEVSLPEKYGVAYIYFDYKEQSKQTPTQVLSSLVRQLANRNDDLPLEVEDLHTTLGTSGKKPTIDELYTTLIGVSKFFDQLIFVFDALDECDPDAQRRGLLPLFQRMASDGINLFLTSRPHPQDLQDCFHDAVKIEILAQKEDIVMYIEDKIDQNVRVRNLVQQGGCRDQVISELVNCAQGMFLLVHFHVDYLCQQTTPKQILTTLEKLKNSSTEDRPLYPTYKRAIDSIRRQPKPAEELASYTLAWLVKAQQVLKMDEIRVAVSIEPNRYELDEMDLPDSLTLLNVCGGLVTTDEHTNTIRLAHYTVQEYLLEESIIPEDADFKLAMACTTYLSFDIFARPCKSDLDFDDRLEMYPFMVYAAEKLDSHLRICDPKLTTDMLLKFLGNPGNIHSYTQAKEDCDADGDPPLHIACRIGHVEVAEKLIDMGAKILAEGSDEQIALHEAAAQGHVELVKLLFKKEKYRRWPRMISAVDSGGSTPLHNAAGEGHSTVVKLLLIKQFNLLQTKIYNTLDCRKRTPLHLTAMKGSVEAVTLLLDRIGKADISTADMFEQTPLHLAIAGGHEEMVRLLLDKGASVSDKSSDRRTALHKAAEAGLGTIFKLLLDKGANISAAVSQGQTALHLAAGSGYEEVAQSLLENGAKISDVALDGRMALNCAADRGYEKVVRLLLEKGVDISAVGFDGLSALHLAAYKGYEEVVSLPLERGADSSAVDPRDGRIALHFAAIKGHETVAGILLEKGADISATDLEGKTALQHARKRGQWAVIKILREKGATP